MKKQDLINSIKTLADLLSESSKNYILTMLEMKTAFPELTKYLVVELFLAGETVSEERYYTPSHIIMAHMTLHKYMSDLKSDGYVNLD